MFITLEIPPQRFDIFSREIANAEENRAALDLLRIPSVVVEVQLVQGVPGWSYFERICEVHDSVTIVVYAVEGCEKRDRGVVTLSRTEPINRGVASGEGRVGGLLTWNRREKDCCRAGCAATAAAADLES